MRLLSPFVGRVVIARPMQVKAIAHARVKPDKVDAKILAQLHAAGFLPEVWAANDATLNLRRLVSERAGASGRSVGRRAASRLSFMPISRRKTPATCSERAAGSGCRKCRSRGPNDPYPADTRMSSTG